MKDNVLYNEVENLLVNECGNYFEFIGSKAIIGRIFGLLISHTEPVSLKEISDKLNISKPSASNNLRFGLQIEMFKKVYHSEFPREDFYILGVEFMEMLIDPGLKKLTLLSEKFVYAKKILDVHLTEVEKDEQLSKLYKKLDYLIVAFKILLEEYKKFGDTIQQRLSKLREDKFND